jgi:hypothetical protein
MAATLGSVAKGEEVVLTLTGLTCEGEYLAGQDQVLVIQTSN